MMRVAILLHDLSPKAAGVFEVARAHAQHLSLAGIEVCVFGFSQDGKPAEFAPNVRVASFKTYGHYSLGLNPMIVQAVKQFGPDIVHTHGIWTGLSVTSLLAARLSSAPLVVSPHGMLDPWALRVSPNKKRIAELLYERRHLSGAAAIHALSAVETHAVREWGLKQLVFELPNGVDLEPRPRTASGWRKDGRRTLLFLGRIHHKKGIFQLVSAWRNVAALMPNWVLRIVGQGSAEDEARLAHLMEGCERIEFLGYKGGLDREACYQHADAFILPSFSEGLPMTVLEAWAHALPTLITPECNFRAAIDAGAALGVSTDVEELAVQLLSMNGLGETRLRAIGEAGRRLCEIEFSWPLVIRRLAKAYEGLSRGGSSCGAKRAMVSLSSDREGE